MICLNKREYYYAQYLYIDFSNKQIYKYYLNKKNTFFNSI